MITADIIAAIRKKWNAMEREMDERARRLWAASEAQALGRGGITAVSEATGMAFSTVHIGTQELHGLIRSRVKNGDTPARRVRREGAGRKTLTSKDPELLKILEALVCPTTRGDPMSPLRWTCKSTRTLALELKQQGHPLSDRSAAACLHELGYSLQGNQKTKEGGTHPDRNAQFEHINAQVQAFQHRRQPVISVDAKKKELVGDFKNGGREWRPKGNPEKVRVHDFEDKTLGKVTPYGVYDISVNQGWVSVGTDHDTAEFAVQTIRQWWHQMGRHRYPNATELLITADGGGSNGSRIRLWKVALQRLADETGLRIAVCHLPPGTSKWNKIEHRMFCHITRNWRGQPLMSHEVIVKLIGNTTTQKGLRIQAALDSDQYPKGIKVSDEVLAQLQIERDDFHGDWNYALAPRKNETLAKVSMT